MCEIQNAIAIKPNLRFVWKWGEKFANTLFLYNKNSCRARADPGVFEVSLDDKDTIQIKETIYAYFGYNKFGKYTFQEDNSVIFDELENSPTVRSKTSLCNYENRYIFAIGGFKFGKALNTVDLYDTKQNKWR